MKSNRKGFTLIELLIVVVIIGILAAIAIPKFANTKEKAYVAAMKSDLRNLMTAEEGYFADFQAFGTHTQVNFTSSQGVTVAATPAPPPAAGYTANASHNQTARTCAVTVGDGSATDGVIICT
jgi:prepilin-type N-terminal cleavage/methylation domain-containing protein